MTLVRFSDQDEFVAELARDPFAVARKLVRTTISRYPVLNGALTRVVVVGSAKVVSSAQGGHPDYDVVEYQEYIGDLWGNPKVDDEITARAKNRVETLEQKLRDEGFEIASGRYELEQRPR